MEPNHNRQSMMYFLFVVGAGPIPDGAQRLFSALCSGFTLGGTWGLCGAGTQN